MYGFAGNANAGTHNAAAGEFGGTSSATGKLSTKNVITITIWRDFY